MILCMVGCSGRRFRHTFFHERNRRISRIVLRDNDTGELDQPRRRTRKQEMKKQKQIKTLTYSTLLEDRTTYGSLRCQTLEKLMGTAMRLLLVPLITHMTIKLSNQEIQKVDKTKFLGILIDQHLTSYHKSSVLIIL